jgi:purine nucleoside phosphorylase
MSNEVSSRHLRAVDNSEQALIELFAGQPPQVVVLAGERISKPLVERMKRSSPREMFLPIDSHRPGDNGDTSKATIGKLGGVNVVIIQGRVHANEGGGPLSSVVIPRAAALAAKDATFLLLNASTGITIGNPTAGQIAIVGDHISSYADMNPLKGELSLIERFGSCRTIIEYDTELRRIAAEVLSRTKVAGEKFEQDFVYLMAPGPQLPTAAELTMYARSSGADLVGNPLPEILALCQMKRRALALSLVADSMISGILPNDGKLKSISQHAESFAERVEGLLAHLVPVPVGDERKTAAV